jgi:hypothetical protein
MPIDSDDKPADPALVRTYRTAHSILNAFDVACDAGDKKMALRLLGTAEGVIARSMGPDGDVDGAMRARLVASRERLWALKRQKVPRPY